MTRFGFCTLSFVVAAGTTYAAAGALTVSPPEPEIIEIEVSAGELDACRETLAQVAQMPVRGDAGGRRILPVSEDLPVVRCVVSDI